MYTGDFSPNVRPIPALRARVLTARGRVGEAVAWAREQSLSATDDLSYLREFEHITLARVLVALHREQGAETHLHDAARLLQRLLQAAEAGSGREVSSRSWRCRRSPFTPVATSRVRWRAWSVR